MKELELYLGCPQSWDLQCMSRLNGGPLSDLLVTDTLSSVIWQGDNQPSIATPAVTFIGAAANGQINVSVQASDSAKLDANGEYLLLCQATRGTSSWPIWEGRVRVYPTPGTGNQAAATYCTYKDMLKYAPWIAGIQTLDVDQEGFYAQRLEATNWLNWLTIRNWRGGSAGYFGDPGTRAANWTGGGWGHTQMPSRWLIDMLSGGVVRQPITITAQGSGYSYANVAFVGGGAPTAGIANATALVIGGQVVNITLMSAGYGYTSAPTIVITGDGTGATATCLISQSVILLRPPVVRTCAHYAIGCLARTQLGGNEAIAIKGAMFEHIAINEATGLSIELDLNGDGLADQWIALGSTNMIFQ